MYDVGQGELSTTLGSNQPQLLHCWQVCSPVLSPKPAGGAPVCEIFVTLGDSEPRLLVVQKTWSRWPILSPRTCQHCLLPQTHTPGLRLNQHHKEMFFNVSPSPGPDTYCQLLFLICPFCIQPKKANPLELETSEPQGL